MKSTTTLRFVCVLSTCLILAAMGVVFVPNAQGAIGVCDTSSNIDVEASGGTAQFGYATLGAAFAAINAGTHTGAIAIEVCGDTAEGAATAVLNASGSGAASYSSISINPVGGVARTISGATTAGNPLISFNGADNVTVDGLNAGGNALTISNTTASATAGTSTIQFINGASFDTVTNASVLGSFSGANTVTGGTIYISTDGSTANGNDNISITNCEIGPAGANLPTVGIYALGSVTTAAIGNNNVLIDNNRISDFFGASVNSSGVYVGGGNSGWTITNNRFYQTAARTWTTTLRTNRPIEVSNSAATTGAQGMTITGNIIGSSSPSGTGTYALSGSSGRFMGIYFNGLGGAAVSTISNNTIASVSVTGVTSSGACSSTALGGIIIGDGSVQSDNNTIGSQSATGSLVLSTSATAATEVCGMYNIGNYSWSANGNNVGGITVTNASTGNTIVYGMRAQTLATNTFTASSNIIGGTVANSIQNSSTTPATAQVIGMASTASSGPSFTCTSNTIRNLTGAGGTGTGTTASVIGISITATAAAHTIQQNTIYGLSNTNASAAHWVTGISVNASTSAASLVARNLIHSLKSSSSSATATINGIYVAGGLATYQNNMIDLGNGLTNGAQINGVNELNGTDNFYFNSVYIGGSGVAGTANTFAFQSSVTVNTRNYIDNIFFNARSNGAGTGKHYAMKVGGSTPNPGGLTSNSNVLYATGTGGYTGLFNAIDQLTLAAWQGATGQDGLSFSSDPNFVDPTGAVAIDLHIAVGPSTIVEGNGSPVGSVTDDFDGQLRAGLTPTDIGADAGNFAGLDLAGPVISYTPPLNTTLTSDRTLTISATDASGVPTSGIGLPALYFRKGTSGAFSSSQCVYGSGSAYNCTFAYASVGGVVPGDVIQYYVAGQDSLGNVSVKPAGASGLTANPPAAATPPPPNSYKIAFGIAGAKTLCLSGCDYASLTNAGGLFDTVNNDALTGNTTVSITGDLTTETGAVALNPWAEDGAGGYTLTIKPGGAARVISGNAALPLIKLSGADRVTFDGSLSGGSDRSLTITNLFAGSAGSVIWMASASASDGATNNTIKNCIIVGSTGTTTGAGIIAGGGTTVGTAAEAPNSDNTIQNNAISQAQNGVFVSGNVAGLDQNWLITGNTIGSTEAAGKMGFRGILLLNAQNLTISNNTINGVVSSATSTATTTGIQIGGTIGGGVISANRISDIKQINTVGYGCNGIYLAAASSASNLTVVNNLIYDVAAYGFNGTGVGDNGYGIIMTAGGGYRLYNNSVRLTTNQTAATGIPAAINITGGITAAGSLDLRDNAFAIAQTIGTRYAIYCGAASSVFSNIDFNDYYPGTGTLGYLGGAQASLAAWQTATGKDASSLFADPLFNTTTDLQPQPGSPLVGAGTPVGVTTDFLDLPRSLTNPSVGAYENALDTSGPTITYGALPNTTSTADRILAISAADPSGVPTSGAGLPVLYFRKGASGAYSSSQCAFVSGSSYSCTFTYGTVGGVVVGDTIQFYVAAQDTAPSPNTSVNPSAGAGGFTTNPPAVSTPPASPNSYLIAVGYAGSYNVGAGETFLSLTNPGGVFEAISSGVLTGDTTIAITSDLTAETGTVALSPWTEEGPGGYTLTFKPSGAPRVVSGTASVGLIRLNGADRVIFDGSLSGGADRSLTVASTGGAQALFWLTSASATNGATNNTIKNCVISGAGSTATVAGIIAGSGTVLGGDAESPNSNNTIQNNQITGVSNALYLRGASASLDQNWLITGNTLGSTVRTEKLGFRGMFVGNSQNVTVSNNTINGVVSSTTTTNTMTGVQFGLTINGGAITGNTISDIKQINTAGAGCNGIYLQPSSTASNVTVANNVIFDVAAYGRAGVLATSNGYGIAIASGGGYRLYHNSVRMTTDQVLTSGTTAAVNITSAVTTAGSLDLRDNVFANTQTVGTRYAIYCGAASTVFSDIDYNDYDPGTGTLGYLTSDRTTLAAWQTATGKDANSVSVDPLFASTTNLQPLTGSPVLAAGSPVGILTDITGAARSLANPSIGAYENALPADLSVTKTDTPDPVAAGSYITYTLTVTNNGPSAASSAVLADSTPPSSTFVSLSAPPEWTCTTPAVGGTGAVSCSAATLAAGAPAVFALVVNVDFCPGSLPSPVGSTTNTAIVSSGTPDTNPGNNSASETTAIIDSGACDDGNACTTNDTCAGGACAGGPPPNCDDGNACTDDSCDPAAGCVRVNNTAPCSDGLDCTANDTCSNGACQATPVSCDDGNICTLDACLEPGGTCDHSQASGACNITGVVDYYRDSPTFAEPSTKPVPGETVLRVSSTEPPAVSVTGATGTYQFLAEAGNITLTPQPLLLTNESECRSAITSADASLMSKVAVLLVAPTPNQRVAGDVTGNGIVSSYDAALTAIRSSSASCVGYVFPIRAMTGSDWAFRPSSRNFTPIQGGEDCSFLGVLYGDITGNWAPPVLMTAAPDPIDASIPKFQSSPDSPAASAGPGSGPAAEIYLASGPTRTADGRWQAVLGLQPSDGILGLDMALQCDPAAAQIRSVATIGLASGFGLVSNDTEAGYLISTYNVVPMQGSGEFLVVTYDLTSAISGLPFSVTATANEGQIPILPGPGIPRGASHAPGVQADLP